MTNLVASTHPFFDGGRAMPFEPAHKSRDRILLYGPTDSAKSSAILQIARRLARTKTDARLWIADTDAAYERLLEEDAYSSLDNVHVEQVDSDDFNQHREVLAMFRAKASPDDWICFDFVHFAWDAAQSHYIGRVYGEEDDEYFLRVRAEQKELARTAKKGDARRGGFEWLKDGPPLRRLYNKWFNGLTLNQPCHVICTAEGKEAFFGGEDGETKRLKDLYTPFGGYMPAGQKSMSFRFLTILLFEHGGTRREPTRVFSTVKEKGRERVMRKELKDFSRDYLRDVAGWGKT